MMGKVLVQHSSDGSVEAHIQVATLHDVYVRDCSIIAERAIETAVASASVLDAPAVRATRRIRIARVRRS